METEQRARILTFLEQRLPEYLDLFRRMVEINSFTLNPSGVNALGRLTAEAFAPLGFRARTRQAEDSRFGEHLVLSTEGSSSARIGLVSHLDTVFPAEEEQRNDFCWRPEGERIYGPGTVDIKGGTIVALMTLGAIHQFFPEQFRRINWRVMLDAAEEHLAPDFGTLCREELPSGSIAALVFEAGMKTENRFRIVAARKGRGQFTVSASGRSTHAGAKHRRGANAIHQLALVVPEIEALTDYDRDRTCNIGMIRGGEAVNRVPHEATLEGEMRAFDPAVLDEGMARLVALNGRSNIVSPEDGYACSITVACAPSVSPWPRNERTDQVIESWQRAAAAQGLEIELEARGGLSDGNYLWNAVPTVDGLGPAGDNDHCSERTPDRLKEQEYVDRTSIVPKVLLNTGAILDLIARA